MCVYGADRIERYILPDPRTSHSYTIKKNKRSSHLYPSFLLRCARVTLSMAVTGHHTSECPSIRPTPKARAEAEKSGLSHLTGGTVDYQSRDWTMLSNQKQREHASPRRYGVKAMG